jgi:hypothetical protein
MVIPKTLDQIRAESPFPWREHMVQNRIFVIDANNKEVPIFSMTAFCELITNHFARNQSAPTTGAPA